MGHEIQAQSSDMVTELFGVGLAGLQIVIARPVAQQTDQQQQLTTTTITTTTLTTTTTTPEQ